MPTARAYAHEPPGETFTTEYFIILYLCFLLPTEIVHCTTAMSLRILLMLTCVTQRLFIRV